MLNQCETKKVKYGNIVNKDQLMENLKKRCVPSSIFEMDIENYHEFFGRKKKTDGREDKVVLQRVVV